MADHTHPPDRQAEALKRLASALDVKVDVFLSALQEGAASELLTLVRLWSAIGDSEGRHRVLRVARQEAERTGSDACA